MPSTASILPRPIQRDQRDPLTIFLLLSLLLHFLFLLFFPIWRREPLELPQEQLTEVELLPTPPSPPPPVVAKVEPPKAEPPPVEKPKPPEEQQPKPHAEEKPKPPEAKPREKLPEQIVNTPDEINDKVPDKARLLSERNTAVKEETVAPGIPRPAPRQNEKPPAPPKEKAESQPPSEQLVKKPPALTKPAREKLREPPSEEKAAAAKPPVQLAMKPPVAPPVPKPSIEKRLEEPDGEEISGKSPEQKTTEAAKRAPQLFARPEELLTQGWLPNANSEEEKKEERKSPQGRDLIALAPPPRESLLSLPGPQGTPDYLPDIRQGNLTFLNTKAHRFAPFVRRVALRVFQHLIIFQRKNLHLDDVVAARDVSTLEVKLDTQGNLKGLVIQTRSGSYAVDEALLKACQNGAWDENPPSEAIAEDGMIHFIFRSDINAQYDDLGLRAILTTLQVGLV